jgi:hypothetical protein
MAQPITKTQLLQEGQQEKEKLFKYLGTLSGQQKIQSGTVGEWSAKDVLAHLIEWHQLVLGWLAATQRGETPPIPAEGYNWQQLPALNQMFYERNRDTPLTVIEQRFEETYQAIRDCITALEDSQLFTPGLHPWMNKNTLTAYFNSCTTSHYRWALKEIRKGIKPC